MSQQSVGENPVLDLWTTTPLTLCAIRATLREAVATPQGKLRRFLFEAFLAVERRKEHHDDERFHREDPRFTIHVGSGCDQRLVHTAAVPFESQRIFWLLANSGPVTAPDNSSNLLVEKPPPGGFFAFTRS
jgi:hypothetical protein